MAAGKKTGGRTKGTPNKMTSPTKDWIKQLIDENRSQIEKDLKALDARDRISFFEKLLKYVVPALSSVSASFELEQELEKLTDEQLNDLADRILNKQS